MRDARVSNSNFFACYDCDPEAPCVLIVPETDLKAQPVCPFNPSAKKWVEFKQEADGDD